MPSSFPLLFDQHNYFVWPNSTALEKTFESADTIDAIFITNHSPAYVSSNCSCNSWKSYFTFATPSTSFTFGAWENWAANGTQVLFDTTIDQTCSGTGTDHECYLTLHNNDGYGYNGWGTPLATVGYFMMNFDGQGTEEGILPVQYSDPKPQTYIYPPAPTATTTASTVLSTSTSISTKIAVTSSAVATTAAQTSEALATSTSSTIAIASGSSHSTSKGVVVGVAVGASLIAVLALLGLLFFFLRCRKKQQKAQQGSIEHFDEPKMTIATQDKGASDVALIERYPPSQISPVSPRFPRSPTPTTSTNSGNIISPEALRDFIAAASLDHRTTLDPAVTLRFPGDELSAPIVTIWDAIAVRETYVSRLSPSINIPTTLESLRKQAVEIAKRTGVAPPVMLSVTSTRWKGDMVGWSEADKFKHSFVFSGSTSPDGMTVQKRLVVRRSSDGLGGKFETHETWAVGNCAECQCYLGSSSVVQASMTVYVGDGKEVEACGRCEGKKQTFKALHGVEEGEGVGEEEMKRAELARQAVEREWERMEEEYRKREVEGKIKKGGTLPGRLRARGE